MENTNQTQEQALQAYMEEQSKKRKRWILGALAAVLIGALSYFGIKNADFFRAAITEIGTPAGTNALFIPNYEASVGDDGLIAVQVRPGAANPAPFNTITFTLSFPVGSLTFNQDSLVFGEGGALLPATMLSGVTNTAPGQIRVSYVNPSAVDLAPGNVLFHLRTQISPSVTLGTVIPLTATNVRVESLTGGLNTALTAMDAGSITLAAQADLRLLYAESLDATHVMLHFSDFLDSPGLAAEYEFSPMLAITAAERGTGAEGQKSVILTTAPQAPGTRYLVTIAPASTVVGHTQGSVDPDYSRALFFGPGRPGTSLSDFRIIGARATGAHTVEVTFSDPVALPSVIPDAFIISIPPALPLTITNATARDSTVTLTTEEILLGRNGYLVTALDSVPQPVIREDGARVGINQAVFRGMSNGPKVQTIRLVENPADPAAPFLDITFDAPVTPGPDGLIGTIHTTGVLDTLAVIDANDPRVTVTGATVRRADFAGDPMANYTFVARPEITANGFTLDAAFNSRSFWGFDHDEALNTVGTASFSRRNVVDVQAGSLNFIGLVAGDLRLFHYADPATVIPDPLAVVTLVGGALRVTAGADFIPGQHYILSFDDVDLAGMRTLLQTVEFTVSEDFEMTGASATGPTEVTVTFSENFDQATIVPTAFTLNSGGLLIGVTGVNVAPNFREVRLTLAAPTAAGTVYQLTAEEVRSFNGGKPLMLSTAVFAGHQTQAATGTAQIIRIDALSSTELEVTFSGDVQQTSVTPLTISAASLEPSAGPLTLSNPVCASARVCRFTTSAQTADRNYFVIPLNPGFTDGIRDLQGLFLNTQRVLNVFGFSVPASTASAFTPGSVVNNAENTVVISGQNLQNITAVRLNNTAMTITNQSASSLSFLVPLGFAAGSYTITLVNSAGVAQTLAMPLLVTALQAPFRIVSESSLATPFRVPPDGTTQTTLRVLVEDPMDLANVTSVTIDLTLIGGAPSVAMTKATGVQPQNRQWYTTQTTIPTTIATSATPALLPVQARKGSTVVNGTAQVHITRDVIASVAPTITQAFFAPPSVAPDGVTEVKLSAQISDADGADTIQSVVANLGAVGVGFLPLTPVQGVGSAAETISKYFESAKFKVPTTTRVAAYPVTITAQDVTGETGTTTVTLTVSSEPSGPSIDPAQSYLAPRSSVPHDGVTPFSINVFVRDPDGMGDVASVIANFGDLGLAPKSLTRSATATDTAKSGYFTAEGLVIPSTTPTGVRQIVVTATDAAGNVANLTLQIDVTEEDTLGDPPRILVDRAYTTPRVAVNDGSTPFSLHVFVRDDDNDIDSVLVNLGTIGQVGPEQPAEFSIRSNAQSAGSASARPAASSISPSSTSAASSAGSVSGSCPANSRTVLCMQPSVREGNEGQWFVLSDITVSASVEASDQPYTVEVVASDRTGKTTRQSIPVLVGTAEIANANTVPVSVVAAVPTSATTLEVVFSAALDTGSVAASGSGFTIVNSANISEILPILGATVNAVGTVVTLTTEPQISHKEYVATATSTLRDAVGVALDGGALNRATFDGFTASDKPPVVEYIAAESSTAISIEFRDPIQPSSMRANRIEIKGSGPNAKDLKVLGMRFVEGATSVELQTNLQQPGARYRVTLRDVSSASGIPSPVSINKLIKGFKGSDAATAALKSTADLNGDGKVDFIDFTMFSAVYGTAVDNGVPAVSTPAASAPVVSGQPLAPRPDATVPVTIPAGSN